ncbi:hypothetical protein ACFWA4_29070 [Streptomyces sp. NPDC060011]|uniref:hypothetical protein n=1 Tax=unclassified Streptomyces TaxID=2593676 RepID=UPI002DD9C640|nr:hypothetical protein [Streptomyces sp. NBC_01558]WSD82347.1 hypothetical protein OHB33_38885 [Streptomyces sp. NBC_01558]
MLERSHGRTVPAWARPGARWGPFVYGPLLCISVGLLVLRITDGAGAASIVWSSLQVLLWVVLLAGNLAARRGNQET